MEEEVLTEQRNILADLAKCKGQDCQKYNTDTVSGTQRFIINNLILMLSIMYSFRLHFV